jgi:hypothetical protein
MPNSNEFWKALAKIRIALREQPLLFTALQTEPAKFLVEHKMDAKLLMGDGRTTSLSKILEDAGPAERGAILHSLFSLAVSNRSLRIKPAAKPGEIGTFDVEGDGSDDPSGDGGDGGESSVSILVYVAAFISVAVVENVSVVANIITAALTNVTANVTATVFANINSNTNGLTITPVNGELASNSTLNSRVFVPTDDFSSGELSGKLRSLGLSLPRQIALLKRAVVMQQIGPEFALSDGNKFQCTYTYRGVSFEVAGVVERDKLVMVAASIISAK